jgi:hypothetical protein
MKPLHLPVRDPQLILVDQVKTHNKLTDLRFIEGKNIPKYLGFFTNFQSLNFLVGRVLMTASSPKLGVLTESEIIASSV